MISKMASIGAPVSLFQIGSCSIFDLLDSRSWCWH